jgi:hypothetical protein
VSRRGLDFTTTVLTIRSMKQPGHKYSLESPDKVQQRRRAIERAQLHSKPQSVTQATKLEPQTVQSIVGSTLKKVPDIQVGLLNSGTPKSTIPTHGKHIPPALRALASSSASSPTPIPAIQKTGNAVSSKRANPDPTIKHSAVTMNHLAKQTNSIQLGSNVSGRDKSQKHA